MEIVLGLIVIICQGILAFLVWERNKHSWTNRLYVILALLIIAYVIVNYISLHPPTADAQLFWIRSVMFVTSFIGPVLLLFVHTFNNPTIQLGKKYLIGLVALMVSSASLAYTPLVFSDLQFVDGMPLPTPGPGILVFLVDFPGLFLLSFIVLGYKYRRSTGIYKRQLLNLLVGAGITFTLMATFSVIFVVFFKTSTYVFLSPLVTIIMMSFMAYSVIEYRFLDIRLSLKRGTMHILTTGVTMLTLSIVVISVYRPIAKATTLSEAIVLALGFLIVSFTFEPIKRWLHTVISPLLLTVTEQHQQRAREEARRIKRMRVNNELSEEDIPKAKRIYREIDYVLNEVVEKIVAVVPKENITLLASDHHTKLYQPMYGYAKHLTIDPYGDVSKFFANHEEILVAAELEYAKSDMRFKDLKQFLPAVEQFMRKNGIAVLVPVKLSQALLGFILVHESDPPRTFSSQDIQTLDDVRRAIYFQLGSLVAQRTAARDVL